ncbi:DUF6292 family protein [Saccharopolyspora shandongensis]|uniref:DUF6292 family protein n=1 Tax=Saccharopolyspora shandongensis TaxID=418495 RepID=UPI0033F68736
MLGRVGMDPGGRVAMGLVAYVYEVARGLGVCPDSTGNAVAVEFELLTSAFIALPFRAPNFPTYDLALVWDEEGGWAVAIETDPSYPPIAISYQGGDVLHRPSVVATFVDDLLAGRQPGQPNRPLFRRADDNDDLRTRLATYRRFPY